DDDSKQDRKQLNQPTTRPSTARACGKQDNEWRYQKRAARIAGPPGKPGLGDHRRVDPSGRKQACDTDRRADQRPGESREKDELKDVMRSLEDVLSVGEAVDQVGGDECFERVPDRDAERR